MHAIMGLLLFFLAALCEISTTLPVKQLRAGIAFQEPFRKPVSWVTAALLFTDESCHIGS